MADLKFELVTPDRLVMSDDVYMVVVPGSERAMKITSEEDFARAEALSISTE